VYAIEWFEDRIDFYVDKTKYFSFANDNKGDYKTWPFNKKFHLLLNVAVGGDWPGNPTTNTIFPKVMQIDYVRVYERSI
jgi:beta-glucanase (GH16 family)